MEVEAYRLQYRIRDLARSRYLDLWMAVPGGKGRGSQSLNPPASVAIIAVGPWPVAQRKPHTAPWSPSDFSARPADGLSNKWPSQPNHRCTYMDASGSRGSPQRAQHLAEKRSTSHNPRFTSRIRFPILTNPHQRLSATHPREESRRERRPSIVS